MENAEILLIYQPKIILIPCVVCQIIEKIVLEEERVRLESNQFSPSSFKHSVDGFSFLVVSCSVDLWYFCGLIRFCRGVQTHSRVT